MLAGPPATPIATPPPAAPFPPPSLPPATPIATTPPAAQFRPPSLPAARVSAVNLGTEREGQGTRVGSTGCHRHPGAPVPLRTKASYLTLRSAYVEVSPLGEQGPPRRS